MSSHCTGPQRLFRCRVRDLASCFYACRLPLEEDQPDNSCSKSPKMSAGSIVLDFDGGGNRSRKASTANKIRGESIVQTSLSSSHREPRFAEEEYIVFCFKEDGEIDMVSEGESSEERDERNGTTTAVTSRKDTQNSEHDDEKRKKEKDNKAARVNPVVENETTRVDPVEENETTRFDPVEENETTGVDPGSDEEASPSKMERWESSDSNRSDTTSASSFAFPVLGIEWIGSPVHMPKSEKQSVSLHCCRF